MRDLSLHLLDLIENSIRARASVIFVTIEADPEQDRLKLTVEDNGVGFKVPLHVAADPFYTTKSGKRTGLGLSLLQAAAERAEGRLAVGRSSLGGAAVGAEMKLSHVDRSPLGDLAATMSAVVCTHPELDVRLRLRCGQKTFSVGPREAADALAGGLAPQVGPLAVATKVSEMIKTGTERVWSGLA